MYKALHQLRTSFFPSKSTSILTAQLQLFYLMLGANVVKGFLYLSDAINNHHGDGSFRAARLMVTSILMIAVLRRFPQFIKWGIHYAIIGTILHIYYRVFNKDIGADVIALQCIYMVVISAFYGLNKFWGAVYTTISAASLILFHYIGFRWTGLQPLPQGINDLYIGVNFLVILFSHLYFHRVLYGNMQEMEVLNGKLEESTESKSNFLSTMSHELRTPLNSVIGIAKLLVDDNKDQKQKEQLDMLKFSAEGLLTLINNILDINKFDSGKMELESVPFNLSKLVHSISRSMAHQPGEKKLKFSVEIDEKLKGVNFLGDPTRLGQIIYNLIGNAVKFTAEGEVSIRAKVLMQKDDQYTVRLEVKDTGIGISESQQKRIFEPFMQASSSTTRKFGGTGLGLSIVKQLVEMFGGEIYVKSVIGEGTSFFIEVMFVKTDLGLADQRTEGQHDENDLSSLRILLAEDNMMNIFFMQQLFKRWSITADIAENGEEVLVLLATKDYDVILMDMHMPVMDGMEAARRIRQLPDPNKAATCIIALTASVSDNIQAKVKECGMDDYLHKPFQLDELKDMLLKRTVRIIG